MQYIPDEETVEANKQEFINLVKKIEREGANITHLLDKLEKSDFYYAPASARYHGAYRGGLVDHCLNVYYNLVSLCKAKRLEFDESTLIIVALFHDISKMNYYEIYNQNKKVYSPNGSKRDDGGNYDWQVVKSYKAKESFDRFIFGSHGQNSEFMIRQFIPLTLEESVAIIHHMGMYDNPQSVDLSVINNKYTLAVMLHVADMISTFVDERII